MAQSAITAILFGAILFVLGMIPGWLAGLAEGLRNFLDDFSPARKPIHDIQTVSSGEIWLVLVGGMMMILGFLALFLN